MNPFWVYILRCADRSYYVGHTQSVAQRIEAHNAGRAALHTSLRRPVALVYSEPAPDEVTAVQRERQIKRWTRAKKEALIAGDKTLLKKLSKRRQRTSSPAPVARSPSGTSGN